MADSEKFEFVWRIENFNSNLPKIGNEIMDSKCFASPNFSVYISGYTQWYLELYPKTGRGSAFIKCLPICMDYSKDCSVNCELSILGKNDTVHITKKMKCRCSAVFHCDFSNAIEVERSQLPLQNDLVFRCILSYEQCEQDFENTSSDTEKLSRDLLNFYKNHTFSDLTLCVGSDKLPVHRTIICIRAPKLAEELCIQDCENKSVVNIENISLPVLRVLLSYIYSGKVDDKLDDFLPELCDAVKRYNLDALKSELFPVITHNTALTRIKSTKESFTWIISNFSSFKDPVVKFIDLDISQFVVTFMLSNRNQNSFEISFKAATFPENKQVYLSCKLSVIDSAGNLALSSHHINRFESDALTKKLGIVVSKEKWEFPTLLKKSDLIANKYLLGDTLKLNMELEVTEGNKTNEIVNVRKTLKDRPSKIVHLNNLSHDLFEIFKVKNRPGVCGEYYDGDCYNDVTLKVGDKEVLCHKAILYARSPAFARMFQTTKQDKIDIIGVDYETLLLMVQYLYSGSVSNVAATEATRLYIAAEKHQVAALARKCISLLEKCLNVQNVCDVLLLADKYSNEAMFNSAIEYMKREKSKVFESAEWEDLYRRNPVLSTKAFSKVCENKNRPRQFYGGGPRRRSGFRLIP